VLNNSWQLVFKEQTDIPVAIVGTLPINVGVSSIQLFVKCWLIEIGSITIGSAI
jgi:hypothetical protein